MGAETPKKPGRRKVRSSRAPVGSGEMIGPDKEPVHGQPLSSDDDVRARIAQRAYEIYLDRGSRAGYALSDWLEAEREVLRSECQA